MASVSAARSILFSSALSSSVRTCLWIWWMNSPSSSSCVALTPSTPSSPGSASSLLCVALCSAWYFSICSSRHAMSRIITARRTLAAWPGWKGEDADAVGMGGMPAGAPIGLPLCNTPSPSQRSHCFSMTRLLYSACSDRIPLHTSHTLMFFLLDVSLAICDISSCDVCGRAWNSASDLACCAAMLSSTCSSGPASRSRCSRPYFSLSWSI
mmetsp:Transcript_30636/g.76185  ORF Transcript_30636/g.76185 Transcript_30636/m.76185 type:complete len:211 (+) Transcript_30636:210-842(+)